MQMQGKTTYHSPLTGPTLPVGPLPWLELYSTKLPFALNELLSEHERE